MIIEGLVVGNLLYLLAFDYMPSDLRQIMAGGIGVGYIVVALGGVITRASAGIVLMFTGVALMVLAWLLGELLDPFQSMRVNATFIDGLRYVVAAMSGVAILCYGERIRASVVIPLIAVTLAFALLIAAISPAVSLGEEMATRFAPFTGTPMAVNVGSGPSEPEGLHSSGYVVAMFFLVVLAYWQSGRTETKIAVPLLMLSGLLVLGYQVRTSWVFLITYFFVYALLVLMQTGPGKLLALSGGAVAAGGAALAALVLVSTVDADQLLEFSSGRTGTYIDRLALLDARSALTLMLGTGPGSDVTFSSVWWWEAKNSHNDFLTSIIEGGVPSLIGRFLFLAGIVMHAGRWAIPYVAGIFVSSMISNALLSRSMIIPLLFIALACLVRSPASAAAEPGRRQGGTMPSAA